MYYPDTCAYCHRDTWCEPDDDGDPQCQACEVEGFFSEIIFPALGFGMVPWIKKVIRDVYGTLREDGSRQYRRVYISVGKKNYKALALDTPIPTPDGWKNIRDVESGDVVFDESGAQCKVTGTSGVISDTECYEVEFSNGEKIIADAGHQWLTTALSASGGPPTGRAMKRISGPKLSVRRVGDREYYYATFHKRQVYIGTVCEESRRKFYEMAEQDLQLHPVGNDLHTRVRTTEEIFKTQITRTDLAANHSLNVSCPIQTAYADLPIDPYVLGAWLGDGTSASATITCGDLDKDEIAEYIRDAGYTVSERKDKSAWRLQIRSQRNSEPVSKNDSSNLQKVMRAVGVLGNKHIPAAYLRASVNQRISLLQGLLDTDGFIKNNGRSISFVTTSEALRDGVSELLSSLGLKHSVIGRPMKCNGREVEGTAWVLMFQCFRDNMEVFRLKRKVDRMRLSSQNQMRARSRTIQIVSVKKVASVPVKCLMVDSPSHLFLAGRMMIPTHNSTMAGGLTAYHLWKGRLPSGQAANLYGAAAARDQGMRVYEAARDFVKLVPSLRAQIKVLDSVKRMRRHDGGATYQVLSADGDVQDGLIPHFAVIDELHRWRTKKSEILWDVLTKGTITYEDALVFEITTAGEEHESPLWFSEHQYALQILSGALKSESFYAAVWSADPKRIESEPEYWKSLEARVAANPSHVNNGGSLKDERLVEELEQAIAKPEKKIDYLRYHLNVPIAKGESPIIEMPLWVAGGGETDLREWREYDVDLLISRWKLAERPCIIGIDLAWTIDLSAMACLFPPCADDDVWRVLMFFWVPEARVTEIQRVTRAHLHDWIDRGFMLTAPGEKMNKDLILAKVRWAAQMFAVREICFDPWGGMTDACQSLVDNDGFTCIEIRQGYQAISAATKEFLGLYRDKQIAHGNNPVLNWNASCLSLASDGSDNVKPQKPPRDASSKRIDGIAAIITAMARASIIARESVYESRGLLFI